MQIEPINNAVTTGNVTSATVTNVPIPPIPPVEAPTAPAFSHLSIEDMQDLAKAVNALSTLNRVQYRVREEYPPIVLIVNPETEEIIREIPTEELQKIHAMLQATINGENVVLTLIDEYI